jgi:hypothetical protein
LRNPISVQLGIGPVCRGKDNLQGEFEFMNAEFEVLKHESGRYIYIRDIGQCCRSVTNDAEKVVRKLFVEYGITAETRIFYDDSDGRVDELVHMGGVFTGFKAGHEGIDLD